MKYVYGFLVLALAVGGYIMFIQSRSETVSEVPAGFHTMSDGTLMKNDTPEMDTQNEQANNSSTTLQTVTTIQTNPAQPVVTLDPNAHQFTINAVNYAYDVTEMKVRKGETVTVTFNSTDGFHDWVVDEFNAYTQKVSPGTQTSVTFVADKFGVFEYYCSVGQHRAHGMVGKLIVE